MNYLVIFNGRRAHSGTDLEAALSAYDKALADSLDAMHPQRGAAVSMWRNMESSFDVPALMKECAGGWYYLSNGNAIRMADNQEFTKVDNKWVMKQ